MNNVSWKSQPRDSRGRFMSPKKKTSKQLSTVAMISTPFQKQAKKTNKSTGHCVAINCNKNKVTSGCTSTKVLQPKKAMKASYKKFKSTKKSNPSPLAKQVEFFTNSSKNRSIMVTTYVDGSTGMKFL